MKRVFFFLLGALLLTAPASAKDSTSFFSTSSLSRNALLIAQNGGDLKGKSPSTPAQYLARCATAPLAIGQGVFGHEGQRQYLVTNILPLYTPRVPIPNVTNPPIGYVLITLNAQAFLFSDSATTFAFVKGGMLSLGRFTTADAAVAAARRYLKRSSESLNIGRCFSAPWNGTYPKNLHVK